MLITASSKHCNEKIKNVIKLVKYSLYEYIAKVTFEELQQSFIQSQSIKPNATRSRECLLLPKENQLFGGADKKKQF